MKVAQFGPLMEISLRVGKLKLAGKLTPEDFNAALDEYLKHTPSPDGLEGFLMLGEREWYASRFQGKQEALAS